MNTKDLGSKRSTFNGHLGEPINFFPSQSVLRHKDNYKSEGSGESQELFRSAGLGNRFKVRDQVQ